MVPDSTLFCIYVLSCFRCYTVGGESGWGGNKSQAQLVEEDRKAALKELEPLKLPGKLSEYTGNVMYPNEESAVWDVDSKYICTRPLHDIVHVG